MSFFALLAVLTLAAPRWLELAFGKTGECECPDCGTVCNVCGAGDKGYRNMPALGDHGKVALTMTAATEEAPDDVAAARANKGKGRRKWKKQNWHVLDSRFSHYRSVVERVIGYLKYRFAFIRGPIFASQQAQLADVLRIACCLSNRNLSKNPQFFFKGE